MAVHTIVGPGLLERAYDTCFFYELSKTEMQFEHQVKLPVVYQTVRLDAGFRVDYIVENRVLVELKAVDALKCQGMLFPNEKNLLSASSASSAVKSIGRCRI